MDKIKKLTIVWAIGSIMLLLQIALLIIKLFYDIPFSLTLASVNIALALFGFLFTLISTIMIREEINKRKRLNTQL